MKSNDDVSSEPTRRVRDLVNAGVVTAFLLAAIACVLPVALMLGSVFFKDAHPTLSPLLAAFSDADRTLLLMRNSLAVTAATLAVSLFFGAPLGFLCFRTNMPLRRLLIFACIPAACVPLYVTATAWMALFGMECWLYRLSGAAWIQGVAYTPLVILITGICFATGDPELEDIASLDAGRFGVFRRVSLRHGVWGIATAAMVVAALSFTDMTVTDVLMVRTFAEEVFTQFQFGPDPSRAAAVSLPAILPAALLCLWVWMRLRHYGEATVQGTARLPAMVDLGAARPVAALFAVGGLALLALAPAAALCLQVRTFANLATSFRVAGEELGRTLWVAAAAASICAALAPVWGWVGLKSKHGRWFAIAAVILLLCVPAPIVGIGLINLLNRPGPLGTIYDSPAAVVFACAIRALPFAVLAVIPALRRIPSELEDASRLDGATWTERMASVVIPASWRAVLIAWFLAFALSVGELGASFLVAPPGRSTLSVRFFTLIHYGVYPDAAGLCLLLCACVALPGGLLAALLWRRLKTRIT